MCRIIYFIGIFMSQTPDSTEKFDLKLKKQIAMYHIGKDTEASTCKLSQAPVTALKIKKVCYLLFV